MGKTRFALMLGLAAAAWPACATETVAFSYDAKGRLVRVVKTGSVNNGVTVTYQHDAADNRKRVVVTGAP